MTHLGSSAHASLIPCLSYRDVNAAIEWLVATFGFAKHGIYHGIYMATMAESSTRNSRSAVA